MCGEKAAAAAPAHNQSGSPPRMRGKVRMTLMPPMCGRITPACAGKRKRDCSDGLERKDHPRVCGEKSGTTWRSAMHGGITPACAGKSTCQDVVFEVAWDHPRVCGEKSLKGVTLTAPVGSPPRVRGKARAICWSVSPTRITPACAGKSLRLPDLLRSWQDHPRVCGEKQVPHAEIRRARGSPPRVRGKESTCRDSRGLYGITPACAGKRMAFAGPVHSTQDHPRVCGEKFNPIA